MVRIANGHHKEFVLNTRHTVDMFADPDVPAEDKTAAHITLDTAMRRLYPGAVLNASSLDATLYVLRHARANDALLNAGMTGVIHPQWTASVTIAAIDANSQLAATFHKMFCLMIRPLFDKYGYGTADGPLNIGFDGFPAPLRAAFTKNMLAVVIAIYGENTRKAPCSYKQIYYHMQLLYVDSQQTAGFVADGEEICNVPMWNAKTLQAIGPRLAEIISAVPKPTRVNAEAHLPPAHTPIVVFYDRAKYNVCRIDAVVVVTSSPTSTTVAAGLERIWQTAGDFTRTRIMLSAENGLQIARGVYGNGPSAFKDAVADFVGAARWTQPAPASDNADGPDPTWLQFVPNDKSLVQLHDYNSVALNAIPLSGLIVVKWD